MVSPTRETCGSATTMEDDGNPPRESAGGGQQSILTPVNEFDRQYHRQECKKGALDRILDRARHDFASAGDVLGCFEPPMMREARRSRGVRRIELAVSGASPGLLPLHSE
jgi:hypothetical protein